MKAIRFVSSVSSAKINKTQTHNLYFTGNTYLTMSLRKEGDVILSSEPFVHVLSQSERGKRCEQCFKRWAPAGHGVN